VRPARVEILDLLQNHRIEPGPDDELPLQPVTAREVAAHIVRRQQVMQFHAGIAPRQTCLRLFRPDLALPGDLDPGFAKTAGDIFQRLQIVVAEELEDAGVAGEGFPASGPFAGDPRHSSLS
jgi:hypothetical protein